MSTSTVDTAPTAPASRKFRVHLAGGTGEVAHIEALSRKNGATSLAIIERTAADGTKTRARGASANHSTFEEAVTRAEQLRDGLVGKGWTIRKGGGFGKKADAFSLDSLPAPTKVAEGAAKTVAAPKAPGKK